MTVIDVVVKGYARGAPHEIKSYENPGGSRGGWELVNRTYRIFEIDTVEALSGASNVELENIGVPPHRLGERVTSILAAELENKRVLVYPRQDETLDESGLSSYEQMLLLEGGNGNSGLPDHLEIHGTFEKADKKSLPFAGMINAWKVTSLDETGPQYRPKKEEAKLELLQKKE